MARALTSDQVSRIVERATLAPSIHNSQPWHFEWEKSSLDVYVDADRQLAAIDPTGRQMHLSVGAAVEFAAIAMRAEGYEVDVAMLPELTKGSLVARVTAGRELAIDAVTRSLVQAMSRRATQRAAFEPRPVPPGAVAQMRDLQVARGCWVSVLPPEQRAELAAALSRAESNEMLDAAYRAELAAWRRHEPGAVDGIPDEALPASDGAVSAVPIRHFDADQPKTRFAEPPEVDDPTVLVIGTDLDDRGAWLDAGRLTGRLLLVATGLGLAASPLTQSLDQVLDRQRLRHQLGFLGFPQMVLRVGYGQATGTTPRRPVEDVLTVRD
jgi:hypothetical protein